MRVYQDASKCHMWPLETCAAIPFWVFFLVSLFTLPPPPFSHSLACPEALQLVTVLPLFTALLKKGGPPHMRGARVIKPQDNPCDFIKPPFKVSSAPGRQGNRGRNVCHWMRGRWREAEEDSSCSDLWFPLLNREKGREGGGGGRGVRCCLMQAMCVGNTLTHTNTWSVCQHGVSYGFLNNLPLCQKT